VPADYHFVSHWRVRATREEVADVMADSADLVKWWPAVWLDVTVVSEGGERGVGKVVDLWTKGWLPYTLRWRFTTVRNDGPDGFTVRAEGDFVGEGRWTFRQVGAYVDAEYDWRIAAEKPMLKRLTWLLRPAFSANHRWAMRQGERSLMLELERRRLGAAAARRLPQPPQPTFGWVLRRHRRAT